MSKYCQETENSIKYYQSHTFICFSTVFLKDYNQFRKPFKELYSVTRKTGRETLLMIKGWCEIWVEFSCGTFLL